MTDYREQAHEWGGPGREAAVDAVQDKLHYNESMHMHEDIGDASCAYCWLRAGKAVMALADAGFLSPPPAVWWVNYDSELADPDLFTTLDAAQAEAVRVYRAANNVGVWGDDPEPVFAWLKHYAEGVELYVDAEATGIVVRQLPLKTTVGALKGSE